MQLNNPNNVHGAAPAPAGGGAPPLAYILAANVPVGGNNAGNGGNGIGNAPQPNANPWPMPAQANQPAPAQPPAHQVPMAQVAGPGQPAVPVHPGTNLPQGVVQTHTPQTPVVSNVAFAYIPPTPVGLIYSTHTTWYAVTKGAFIGVFCDNDTALEATSGVPRSRMKKFSGQLPAVTYFNRAWQNGFLTVV